MITHKINILKNQNYRFLSFIDLSLYDKIIAFFIVIFFIIFFLVFSFFSSFSSFSPLSFRFARSRLRLFLYCCCDEVYNENVLSFSNYNEDDLSSSNCDNIRNANNINDMSESSVKNKIIFFLIELLSLFIFLKKSRSR